MVARILAVTAISLLACPRSAVCQPERISGQREIARFDSLFRRLAGMHEEIKGIHPLLAALHPVTILEGDTLFIFDTDSTGASYRFQRKEPVPFPMQKGIRASFPLSSYGNKPTCVVSPEVFDLKEGYATIFHEFVHCAQAQTCENSLKQGLHLARTAAAARDYSWEINHPFPYVDSVFTAAYSRFLAALRENDPKAVASGARDLKRQLTQDDYEYMVWVEWKEGLARYVENKIRHRYTMGPNLAGREQPFDRVTFYYGGESVIAYIEHRAGGTLPGPEQLFGRMFGLPGEE